MEELQNEIHRYKISDISNLVKDIRKNQINALPNVNIRTIEELEEFYNKYNQNTQFSEVWFFKKNNSQNQQFSIGRISFDNSQTLKSMETQTVEQIWNSNHRDINNYNGKYEKAYLRASRKDWAMRYKIDKINVPKDKSLNKNQIFTDFVEAVKEIERKRENIEQLSKSLEKMDIHEFTLEYLLQQGKVLFIDWDSHNDLKVINNLFRDKR